MTYEEHKRIKAQIIKGEESLSCHYNLDDNGTARALIDTCIKIIQDDEAIINCLEQYKEANEKKLESNEEWIQILEVNNKSLKAEIETEKKVNNLLMQDVRDKSKELFDAELKHKLYKAKQEGLTSE